MTPSASADAPVIALEDVSITFGNKRVLDGLSLEIPRGKTTVIIGRSGSGKTVLLKLMTGLLKPDRGRVRLFGRDLATLSYGELLAARRRMAMLFQNYALFDSLSVADNVEFPLVEAAGAPPDEAGRQAHELIAMLGLADSKHVLPGALSGGMKRRVALARSLITRPEVALFDEPTTGLDPIMVEQADELIMLARQKLAMTMVIISHDLASVRRLADRVAFLHDGRIIFVGSYDELLRCELPPIRELVAGASQVRAPNLVSQSQPVIELVGVHKRFGNKHVLRGVDLAIYPHRITALIGGSGSGKSVLVKHILGLLQPDRGRILVFGKDIVPMHDRELAAVRRRFALVFQHAALLDGLSVEDNVAFPLVEQRRVSSDEVRTRVSDLLDRLGLGELRRRMPSELSVGERKRVGLARAMVTRPDILIYDEATTGQDPVRAHEIEKMIVEAHAQFGVTTIVISHDMGSVFRIAHTIAMLHDGKIVACGTPAELGASANTTVHHFLHAAGVSPQVQPSDACWSSGSL